MQLEALHRELGIPPDYRARSGLSLQSEANPLDLLAINVGAPREIRLLPAAVLAWTRLRDAAAADAIPLIPLSGYRSIARQAELIRSKLAAGQPIDAILTVNAAPGYSEHHTGRALDIGTVGCPPLDLLFAGTAAYDWLLAEASAFGFHLSFPPNNPTGIGFEPWHWCWRSESD
jgi:D-alanyl-D-alanine carboxypeptidase